ncbi:NADPH-dependent F420 reductase [Rhodococcus qingshengii]|uniref:NADPH-dependent F420 reductase n=1 Tax=Rhodococcus qingshengii TaxID=334542 RepID=UPI0010A5AD0E|nr:NAD(P)-binding domain-containing protein [Rhodococcus qingshengii]THJ66923.1 NADP oxidoreductase [Rhodococcus qingshengii]
MKIGILGAGSIGATLARQLSAAGHDVKVANSRGPESIKAEALVSGARAVTADEVVDGVDVLISSIPFSAMPSIAPLLQRLSDEAVVIDTSNYYPSRDERIAAVDDGQVESVWVTEAIGRPIAKAWNAIGSESLANKATDPGDPQRVAIPVAADRDHDREVALQLVDDSGFDAVDTGAIADSWRHQPGSPAYSTNLTREQLTTALRSAEKSRLPRRRDLQVATVTERTDGFTTKVPNMGEWLVQLNRAIYM